MWTKQQIFVCWWQNGQLLEHFEMAICCSDPFGFYEILKHIYCRAHLSQLHIMTERHPNLHFTPQRCHSYNNRASCLSSFLHYTSANKCIFCCSLWSLMCTYFVFCCAGFEFKWIKLLTKQYGRDDIFKGFEPSKESFRSFTRW